MAISQLGNPSTQEPATAEPDSARSRDSSTWALTSVRGVLTILFGPFAGGVTVLLALTDSSLAPFIGYVVMAAGLAILFARIPSSRSIAVTAISLACIAVGGWATGHIRVGVLDNTSTHKAPSNGIATDADTRAASARIVTPREGERIGLCPAIRGVLPATRDGVYFFAVQGVYEPKPYIYKQVHADPARFPEWDLGKVGVARDDQVEQDFYLLLIRTGGDATRILAGELGRDLTLPAGAEVVDRVRVTRTAQPAC